MEKQYPKYSKKERRKKFSKVIDMEMYHHGKSRPVSGFGNAEPLTCDICNKIVHQLKFRLVNGEWLGTCNKC